MKTEMKVVIGLLAVIAVALIVMVARSGGPQQVQLVQPGKTKADYERMLADAVRELDTANAEIAIHEERLAALQADFDKNPESDSVAGGKQVSLTAQKLLLNNARDYKRQQEELVTVLKHLMSSM